MARTVCLVCFISTVNGHCNKKKKRKEEAYPWKAGANSGHTTNLKQSILRLLIYMSSPEKVVLRAGLKVLMKVVDNILLIVGNPQGILDRQPMTIKLT